MTPAFIDTSFLIALVLTDDALHEQAVGWQRKSIGPLLTTEYVLVEFADALVAERLRPKAIAAITLLRSDRALRIVPASTPLFEEGLQLFRDRSDKRWSLTDCISFIEMKRVGATDALSADRHFEQAGFTALLRHAPP